MLYKIRNFMGLNGFNGINKVWTGFKIAVRPKLVRHNKTKLSMGFNNLVVIV